MARRKPGEVSRKVYFYRIDPGQDEDGQPRHFDVGRVFKHVGKLSFDAGERYLEEPDGNATCCWVDDARHIRMANVRRSGLPHVEQRGKLKPLTIPATSGLVEETPLVFFPQNIVGVAFNFYGPRVSRLAKYLALKAAGVCPPVTFEPLLRPDVTEQLKRLGDIRLFQLKIRASWAATLAEANDDLATTFRVAADAGDAEEVELVLRPKRNSRKPLATKLLRAVRRIVGLHGLHEEASKFVVRGLDEETHKVEELDLLKDQLVSKKTIVLADERSRALSPASAYEAIEEAHSDLKEQLHAAAGAST